MRLTFLLLILSLPLAGQRSLFDELFESHDTILIEIDTDWKKVIRSKQKKEYRTARLGINGSVYPGEVRTRGHVRLKACRYPSLKVKLDKEVLSDEGFSVLNDLKFVVQCSRGRVGKSYLRREKLLYDLHAIVSPYHHRTVPLRVVVSSGDTLRGFLIETEEQLAARYVATVVEEPGISTRSLERSAYANMCLFNYMILNTDWNVYNLHNVECLVAKEKSWIIPIPYDFDYSGLVGTHYSIPREGLGLRSVYQPKFLGRHLSAEDLTAAARIYLDQKEAILERVRRERYLEEEHRERITERLTAFFAELEDESRLSQLASY